MKIAVIGARGFIGRRLTPALTRAGHEVVAVTSESSFDPLSGLLTSPAVPAPLDAIVYLSQSPRYRDVPRQAAHVWGVNVVSAMIAAEWGRRLGVRQFIYASTGTIYSPSFAAHPETDPLRRDRGYALSKIHAEEALRQFDGDMRVCCARCFGVYGPGQRDKLIPNLIASMRAGRAVELQRHPHRADDAGGVRLSMIHVDDAVRAFMALVDPGLSGPINIAAEVLSIRQMAEAIGNASGIAPVFADVAQPREGDVIADTSRLAAIVGGPYKTLESSIGEVIDTAMTAAPE